MTLPGSKTIAYSYDANGRLIGLTAWGNQHSDFHYDKVGRHVATQRPNGLLSDYAYNPAGHLRRVRHRAGSSLRGQFNYTVDGRGNRTRAYERVAQSTTVTNTLTKTDTAVTFTRGTWTDDGAYKKTTQFSGRMQIAYTGDEALLTVGVGPDHGIIDISINGRYWRRLNTYAAQPGEQVIHIPAVPTPPGATSGVIEIRNRSDRHHRSTGRVFRFKQLQVIDTTHTDTTIDYTYDALSRLQQANYNTGERVYDYNFDLAGNRIQEALSGTSVTAKTTDYTYNAANQLTNDGTHTLTYDANGNLTSDGTNTYTWDRANRLTQVGNTTYTYDGLGNRISQSIGTTTPIVTQYLLDTQPGLTKVLAATTGTNTDHYIHSVRGIHAMESHAGDWSYMAQDGLGSVRSEIDSLLKVSAAQNYAPYGEPFGGVGNFDTPFAFTGEQTDANGQLYLRARYYHPSLGVFNSRDPFEGITQRPMSLNGYSWVEGNPIMHTDPSGEFIGIGVAIGIGIATIVAGGIGLMIANPCSHPNYRRAECDALVKAVQDICLTPFDALNRVINPPGVADPDREYYPGNPLKNPPIWTPVPTRAPSPPPKTPTPTPGLPFPSPYDLSDPNPGGTPAPTPGTKPQPQPQPTRVLTPRQTPVPQYHIALGYSEYLESRPAFGDLFVGNLQQEYGEYVYQWETWWQGHLFPDGIPLVDKALYPYYPDEFRNVVWNPKTYRIHFNLEDYLHPMGGDHDSYMAAVNNYPKTASGKCDYNATNLAGGDEPITDWELCYLVHEQPTLLGKTTFYDMGSTSPIVVSL